MRLRSLTRQAAGTLCALAAMACILLALAATAGAVPTENVGPPPQGPRAVATPTIVRETVVRPGQGTDAIVFVLLGVGTVAAMLGSGYLGARIAVRATRVRPTDLRTS
jgi:hypothetical protein